MIKPQNLETFKTTLERVEVRNGLPLMKLNYSEESIQKRKHFEIISAS